MEKYVQARMGGNHLPETTGKWIAASFEHDSARPVNGYAAPQLHTHVVFFNLTETQNGESRALQPHELYRSQQYATAIYRSELALQLKDQGYDIERGNSGQPEISYLVQRIGAKFTWMHIEKLQRFDGKDAFERPQGEG